MKPYTHDSQMEVVFLFSSYCKSVIQKIRAPELCGNDRSVIHHYYYFFNFAEALSALNQGQNEGF